MISAMDSKQCISLIEQEIKWCKENHKDGDCYEAGFIGGLLQAKSLIVNAEKEIKNKVEDSMSRFING